MNYFIILFSLLVLAGCQTNPKTSSTSESNVGRKILTTNAETRGGTTDGVPVEYDTTPSPYFEKIKSVKSKKEKDRLAILSQTGDYQVHFEFVETIPLSKKSDHLPYYSWSTEYVFPIKTEENYISLQHILVMSMKDKDGKVSGPHVVKHWRQDWKYEDNTLLVYKGHKTWDKQNLPKQSVKGTWTQAVYQVDDSPRYKTYGAWEHFNGFSRWISVDTPRPLPRREFTVRSDYDYLMGVNTVTVTPTSWYHEQENIKVAVDSRTLNPTQYLAKEIGLNRYEKIKNYDFTAGKTYWENTKAYWQAVRTQWDNVLASKKRISLKDEMNGKKLHEIHFEFAEKLNPKSNKDNELKNHAKNTINSFTK